MAVSFLAIRRRNGDVQPKDGRPPRDPTLDLSYFFSGKA
jgi:hypothetical protein